MYRLNYTNLNKGQVEEVLSKRTSPVCASSLCTRLAGKSLKIVLDKTPVPGPALEYEFSSDSELTLKENGAAPIACEYGALTLGNITLFSHMVPDTKKGYTVIVNWASAVVTAYEMWFIDYEGQVIDTTKEFYEVDKAGKLKPFVNREVQRQYYFGYFEIEGKEPPKTRDGISLRLENTIAEWKEDRGKHRLTTYTSTTYSTMVELDTPDGGDTLTFVSDVLRISDFQFIYSFGEVEYSGRLSVEVIDLFSMKKIGVSFGIDEQDKFEHTLYKGCGKFLGRFATFQDFNDRGTQYSDFITSRFDYSVKGARATYRPSIMTKRITPEELEAASKNTFIFDEQRAKERVMMSQYVLEDTDYCAGRDLTFRGDDGFTVEMRFKGVYELEYRARGESEWHTERYSASELDRDLIVFAFYRTGSNPPESFVFALDFANGCATCISSKMNSKYDLHDPVPSYHFGVIEMEGLTPLRIFRHGFTDELLGRAFVQTYSDNMSSIHIYNAPHSYSWTICNNAGIGTPSNRAGGPVWSSPCEYLKLREDVYVMSWVEQKWSGHMDTLFRNLRTGRDCGFAYGVSYDGTSIYMDKMGAISRQAGSVDLKHLYPLRGYNPNS